jgi:hypothetical protein
MKAKHRKLLCELLEYTNKLGGDLDGTATHESKYKDRQKANMLTYKVLYAVLSDHPENDNSLHDFEVAREALNEMKALTTKNYPDKRGFYNFNE